MVKKHYIVFWSARTIAGEQALGNITVSTFDIFLNRREVEQWILNDNVDLSAVMITNLIEITAAQSDTWTSK